MAESGVFDWSEAGLRAAVKVDRTQFFPLGIAAGDEFSPEHPAFPLAMAFECVLAVQHETVGLRFQIPLQRIPEVHAFARFLMRLSSMFATLLAVVVRAWILVVLLAWSGPTLLLAFVMSFRPTSVPVERATGLVGEGERRREEGASGEGASPIHEDATIVPVRDDEIPPPSHWASVPAEVGQSLIAAARLVVRPQARTPIRPHAPSPRAPVRRAPVSDRADRFVLGPQDSVLSRRGRLQSLLDELLVTGRLSTRFAVRLTGFRRAELEPALLRCCLEARGAAVMNDGMLVVTAVSESGRTAAPPIQPERAAMPGRSEHERSLQWVFGAILVAHLVAAAFAFSVNLTLSKIGHFADNVPWAALPPDGIPWVFGVFPAVGASLCLVLPSGRALQFRRRRRQRWALRARVALAAAFGQAPTLSCDAATAAVSSAFSPNKEVDTSALCEEAIVDLGLHKSVHESDSTLEWRVQVSPATTT